MSNLLIRQLALDAFKRDLGGDKLPEEYPELWTWYCLMVREELEKEETP